MFTRIILATLVLGCCLNCKRALMAVYGIKKPAIETHESLHAYLDGLGMGEEPIYVLKDTNELNFFIESHVSMPEAFFFNSNGEFVQYKETPQSCNAGVANFTKQMAELDSMKTDSAYNLAYFLDRMRRLPGMSSIEVKPQQNAYVVLLWARFLGKLNKDKIFDWVQHIQEAQKAGVQVQYFLVSYDYITDWGITEKDLPEVEFQ